MQPSKKNNTAPDDTKLLGIGTAKHLISRQIPIAAFALVLSVTTLISFLFYFETEGLLSKQTNHELAIETNLVEPIIEQLYRQAYADTLFLSRTPPIQAIINAKESNNSKSFLIWRERLEQIFSEFIDNKAYYYQFRFIGVDDNGLELINVRSDKSTRIMPEYGLQEKFSRPYFQATMERDDGEVYFSKVELAKNNKRIEFPFKAVLRVATPVYNSKTGQFFGVIVINLDFNRFIQKLKNKTLDQISFYLANQEGDFISHPDSTKNFGFDLGKRHLLQDEFPSLKSSIENNVSEKSLSRIIIENKSYLGHYRKLTLDDFDSAHPLNLLVLKNTTEIEKTLNTFKFNSLLYGSILAFIALVIAALAARKITTPLKQITDSLANIEKVSELKTLPIDSTTEVGVLARSFHNLYIRMQWALNEQHHSALQAEQAANKINAIFNSAAEGFITINEQGTVTSFNKAAQEMFNYTEQEILGNNINILMPTNHSTKHDGYLTDYVTTGQASIIGVGRKLTAKRKSGELFPIHLAISKVKSEQGLIFTGIIRDISKETQLEIEKEENQNALVEVNERMSLATDAANIGIWQYDVTTDTLNWDERMFALYGYDKSKFTHSLSDWQSAVHPNDLAASINAIEVAIENKSAFDHEFRVIQSNGNIRYIKAMALTKLNDAQKVIKVIGVNFDITERKNIEQEHITAKELAEEATRHKAEFLASMSHEIRTPMNGILGMLGLLKRNDLSEEQMHRVDLANSSAEALLNLLNDILDFSKVEAGKLELEIIDFDLRKLFGEFAESVALKSQEKNIEIILDNRGVEQSHVKGDPGRIRQILNNLTSNAIKFTETGEIVITAKLTKASDDNKLQLICSISDTGIGIPSKKISSLFESFTQVDASTTRKYGGTGLGLAICKQLCKMMDGDISVVSTLNKGSTFSFNIELINSEHAYHVSPNETIEGAEILIVDDNATNRLVLTEQLEFWGAKVRQAQSGDSALTLLENSLIKVNESEPSLRSPIKVAFLDMHMPYMNGAMLAEKIKSNEHLANIKLVMMTSMATRGDASYFASLGFDAYFPKPAITNDLLKALQLCLSETAAQKSTPFITHHYLQDLEHNTIKQNTDDEIYCLNGCRLLLVEDNRINQEVARHILEELGIYPDIAANGYEALETLKTANNDTPFNIILMDCQMPEMDGYQATKAIRKGQAGDVNKDIVIVAMTANAMMGDKEKCLAAGMTDYLSKPVEPLKIKDKLLKYLIPAQLKQSKSSTLEVITKDELVSTLDSAKKNQPDHSEKADTNNRDEHVQVWDKEQFSKRLGGNKAIQIKLLELFLDEMPRQLNELKQSIHANDLLKQQEVSHKIQGITANISANQLMTLVKQVNKLAKALQGEDIKKLLPEITEGYEILVRLINESLEK
jgi:PAS domain S-box-containing protein